MKPSKSTYHQYSRHVSNALAPDQLEFYRKYPIKAKKRFPTIDPTWFVDTTKGIHNHVVIFDWVCKHICDHEPVMDLRFSQDWNLMWDVVISSLDLQIKCLTNSLTKSDPELFLGILRKLRISEELKYAGKTKSFVINLHVELEKEAEKGNYSFRLNSIPTIELAGDLVILHRFPGGPIVITYQMLINCLDKLEAKFSWLFYVTYMDIHPSRLGFETKQLFFEIYNILEQTYKDNGNEAIRLCKLLEPILVGVALQSLDPTTHDHQFGNIIKDSFKNDFQYLQPYLNMIWSRAKQYLDKHGDRGIPYLLEQYGQEKLHNYPIVSIEAGLKKMHLYGTSIRVSQEQAVRDIASNFKREYFVAYYEKHKVLPKVLDNWRLDPRIRKLILKGRPGSIRECYKIPNDAWYKLEYGKNHDFNYFPQISDLLDDKAISPHLSHIYQLFAWDALDVMNLKKPYTVENTRLILEILNRPTVDIRAFYEEVEKLGHIPKNWAIIQLMAKERELKIEARTFSILTFECRMMASACERNLGDHILPLFKQQSMTLSGSELKHKMDILSTLPETENHLWIVFHHDLQQWNYTFRSYQQAHLINVLCDLFGVNHFRYLMHIFTDSLMFSANKFTPPGFPGAFTTWDTHSGGNQGILQKLWTLITIIVIRNVMHMLDLEHRLTGSGDNQVLFVKLLKSPELERMIQLIKTKLKEAFEAIGLALKTEETWTSKDLVCYQRKYYFKGSPIPGGIKISARAFSGTGDINAGLNSIVTTAINGGVGLTDQHSDPLIGPAFAYSEIFLNLLFHQDWTAIVPHIHRPLVILSLLSSDFGFLPFIQLSGFLYAGHQDMLSESLALLRYVWDNYPDYRQYIAGAVKFKMGNKDMDSKLQLIMDPTAINIDRPRLPEAVIRDKVESFLMSPTNVNNVQLKTMFSCCKKDDQLILASELIKLRPINTALLHSLFECSHIGSLLGTLSRFNKISSLVKLVGLNKLSLDEECFTSKVRKLDIANLRYFFRRIRLHMTSSSGFIQEVVLFDPIGYQNYCSINKLHPDCTFSLRIFLIAASYGLGTEFITGPYTPAPSEQLQYFDRGLPHDLSSTLVVNPSYNIPDSIINLEQTRGIYNMYIGSRTADPVRTIKLTTLDGIEAGTAIKTLLKILAWMKSTSSDSNILSFIISQLGMRMEGLEDLIPGLVPGTAGGCIDHRFGSPGTVMWAYSNSLTLISTWYQITSNQATLLQRGEEDKFVFFQQLYHHIFSALRFCHPYQNRFGVTIRMDHCSYNIPESKFKSPPIYLPGQNLFMSGLVLDPIRKESLRLEAEHYTKVMSRSTMTRGSGQEILSSVISQEVSQSIIMYSLGLEELNLADHRVHKNQTSINLTLIRKVPLHHLLANLGLQLAMDGYFGRRVTLDKLIHSTRSRAKIGSMVQSVHPFLDILQAIITGGLLSQLMSYTRSYWQWDSSTSIVTLIKPLMLGITKALIDWKRRPYKIFLLIEVKSSNYTYKRIIQFFYHWHPNFAKLIQLNQDLPDIKLIEEINNVQWFLQLLLVTDKGIAVEYGRRIYKQLLPSTDQTDDCTQNIPSKPTFTHPGSGPWILCDITQVKTHHNTRNRVLQLIESRSYWNLSTKNLTLLSKWNKAISSGRFKLAEIISRVPLGINPECMIVTLAEGAGSFLSYLLHFYPLSQAMYNSKITPDDTPPAMAGLYNPPELLCPCSAVNRVINLPELSHSYGDLSKEETWSELSTYVSKYKDKELLVTLDIPYIKDQSHLILNLLLGNIVKWKPKVAIIKVTLEELLDSDYSWFTGLCGLFKWKKWIKPSFSNPYSTEIYLVLQDFMDSRHTTIEYSIESVLNMWELLPYTLTNQRLGQYLIESLSINITANHCPSYTTDAIKEDVHLFGSLLALIKEPFVYLFKQIYRKFWLHRELERTEQTMLHSMSSQSSTIRSNFYAITKSLELYLTNRGIIISDSAHQSLLARIGEDPGPLLTELQHEELSAPNPKAWTTTLQYLGFLLSLPDSFNKSGTIEIISAWFHLILQHDKFFIFHQYRTDTIKQLSILLNNLIIELNQDWLKDILDPVIFHFIVITLTQLLKHLSWNGTSIQTDDVDYQSIVDSLPWPSILNQSSGHVLKLVRNLSGEQIQKNGQYLVLPIMIIYTSIHQESSYNVDHLMLTKQFHEGTIRVYSIPN